MKSIDKLLQLAEKFEKRAQSEPATAGDVVSALRHANLWNVSSSVAPLLGRLGAADRTTASISLTVSPGPDVSFSVVTTPDNQDLSQRLAVVLKQKFGSLMIPVLRQVNIVDPITVNWLKVTELKQR